MRFIDKALTGRNILIPYPRPDNLNRARGLCNNIIIDNGAFTIWRKGGEVDWNLYYDWVEKIHDRIELFFIPDVIDGTETKRRVNL